MIQKRAAESGCLDTRKMLRSCFPRAQKVTPGDPGHPRSCPKVARQCPQVAQKLSHETRFGQFLPFAPCWAQTWPSFHKCRPKSDELDQFLPNTANCWSELRHDPPKLAKVAPNWGNVGPSPPNMVRCWHRGGEHGHDSSNLGRISDEGALPEQTLDNCLRTCEQLRRRPTSARPPARPPSYTGEGHRIFVAAGKEIARMRSSSRASMGNGDHLLWP